MRVCASFPRMCPGTKCQSFWEPGTPCHKHCIWVEAIWGPGWKTNPFRLGLQALYLWLLWESSGNLPYGSATSWSQCVNGQPLLICPNTATRTLEKKMSSFLALITICPATIMETICFQFLRCKNDVTAPEINSPKGPIRQQIRYGNHSNPYKITVPKNKQFLWCNLYFMAPKKNCLKIKVL